MPEAPIGSIVAYAGPIDREEFESATGWMLCDGREMNLNNLTIDLFNAIGFAWGGDGGARFNIPDLQGFFLRGVDNGMHRDPDSGSRLEIQPGGAVGRSVGSWQRAATGAPSEHQSRFTAYGGEHQHTIDFQINATRDVGGTGNTVAHPAPSPTGHPTTESTGDHQHDVFGGDSETRPINAYVNWIIRVQ